MAMSLELSIGAWLDHGFITEDNEFPSPRIYRFSRKRKNPSTIQEWLLTDLVLCGPSGGKLSCCEIRIVMVASRPEDRMLQPLSLPGTPTVFLSPPLPRFLRRTEDSAATFSKNSEQPWISAVSALHHEQMTVWLKRKAVSAYVYKRVFLK